MFRPLGALLVVVVLGVGLKSQIVAESVPHVSTSVTSAVPLLEGVEVIDEANQERIAPTVQNIVYVCSRQFLREAMIKAIIPDEGSA